jgi:hypothetical protein
VPARLCAEAARLRSLKDDGSMAARKAKAAGRKARRALNRKIDEEIEESFPASDPPAFMGGKHLIGAPRKRPAPKASSKKGKTARKKA